MTSQRETSGGASRLSAQAPQWRGEVASYEPPLIDMMLHAHVLLERYLRQVLSPLGLTPARFEILCALANSPEGIAPTVQITKALDRHPTTVSSLIEGLVGAGLVERSVNSVDRRATLITITEAGRQISLSAAAAVQQMAQFDTDNARRLRAELDSFVAQCRKEP